jgi:hypothetical protein
MAATLARSSRAGGGARAEDPVEDPMELIMVDLAMWGQIRQHEGGFGSARVDPGDDA